MPPNGPPIFKPGPVRTAGAFLFRFVRRRPGLSLYIALLLPWLLGSKDPAWATVAEIMLILAIPLLILSHVGGIVIGPFIFLGSRRQDRP